MTFSPLAWASWPNSCMYSTGFCCSFSGVRVQYSGSYMTHWYDEAIAWLAMSDANWA
jgi:hypothetical protein